MNLPHADVDPDGLLEYSVVFTDRSLNHMSQRFTDVMNDLVDILQSAYRASTVAVVPGGGTYGMEAIARQLATGRRCLVVRNGLFSYRWSQILEVGAITDDVIVRQARRRDDEHRSPWTPAPLDEVREQIREHRPQVVFAPHVETASGIELSDDYMRGLADAVHEVGGVFVLDCVASGALWVDMHDVGADVLLTAPQKGWSGTPCAGYVMLSEAGAQAVRDGTSTSFSLDLKKWLSITESYTQGKTPYHATMPTDGLAHNVELMKEARDIGFDSLRAAQRELGSKVRAALAESGLPSVAADSVASPTVVVSYTDVPELQSGAAFKAAGVQVAAGVPLQCGEPEDFSTFRIGLFGLDKLNDVDGAVERLKKALTKVAT